MRYFVSGHRDLTKEEFEEHYVPLIQKAVKEDSWVEFNVGDWEGFDSMFLEYMYRRFNDIFINVYYVEKPRPKLELVNREHVFLNKRDTYDICDESMTRNSDFDIAWIRPGKEDSHTAKNIRRRYGL